MELAGHRFGGLDCLINNAAIYRTLGAKKPLTGLTNDEAYTTAFTALGAHVVAVDLPQFAEAGNGAWRRPLNKGSAALRAAT